MEEDQPNVLKVKLIKNTQQNEELPNILMANIYQIAHLNKLLPKGFKFELYDLFKKNDPSGSKKGKKHSVINNDRAIFHYQNPLKVREKVNRKLKPQKKLHQKLNKKQNPSLNHLKSLK